MAAMGGMKVLPTSQVCFHCVRRRGGGDSMRRGTSIVVIARLLPARALLVVRPIVCATRIGIGILAII